uniref:Eukaryotic translation initiation factor 4E binding protein 1 n=1 Tax=Hucho hucho TaxID=62062 RepID=A0A4W5NQX7_9TELE
MLYVWSCSKCPPNVAHIMGRHVPCTRIIYDRKFLLECRTSTLAHNTTTDTAHPKQPPNNLIPPADKSAGEDAQFEMDI